VGECQIATQGEDQLALTGRWRETAGGSALGSCTNHPRLTMAEPLDRWIQPEIIIAISALSEMIGALHSIVWKGAVEISEWAGKPPPASYHRRVVVQLCFWEVDYFRIELAEQ
jgi:hypothetical protein